MVLSSSDTWIGSVLRDRYTLQQQLGHTTGRRTFLAQDLQTEQSVVVKVVSFGDDFEWADLRLFEREGEVLKSLDHPAIPKYLDYFNVDLPYARGYALVQSYVEGRSLQAAMQAGQTFTEGDLVAIAQQLLDILTYLHGQTPPVIHRDIKPSNVLISDRSAHSVGKLYLVDFGSVQAPALSHPGTLTIVGTYGYMPPEQFGGRAEPASDLYSLGATLIYLATGKHPAELPQRNFKLQFEPQANHLSFALRRWLTWLITPDLAKRPQSTAIAQQELSKAAAGNTDLVLRDKPPGSKIMLSRNDDKLELVIPPWGFKARQRRSWIRLLLAATTISIVSSVVSWVFYAVMGILLFAGGAYTALFFIPVGIFVGFLGLVVSIWVILNPLWIMSRDFVWQVHLRANQDTLEITRELVLGLWGKKSLLNVPCDRVLSIHLETVPQQRLVIRTKDTEFVLDDKIYAFTIHELRWIGQELSDWFGITLTL